MTRPKSGRRRRNKNKSSSSSESGGGQRKKGKSRSRSGPPPPRVGFGPPRHPDSAPPKLDLPRETYDLTAEILGKYKKEADELRASNLARKQSTLDALDLHLDDWQQEVLQHLDNGESVIVDAPTTAGKTRAVEFFFRKNISDPKFRAAYTTPVKSLSNDKLREFREMFGKENVGIATGDFKENLGAPIVVATLECYRNSLLGVDPDLGRTLVVFDEYHFLQDGSRGGGWEESIILTPPHCQLLMLSASVDNSQEFQSWITHIRKQPCHLVRVQHRPVPLQDLVYVNSQWVAPETIPNLKALRKTIHAKGYTLEADDIAMRAPSIEELNLTPCIVYAGRRLLCEQFAGSIAKKLKPLPQERSIAIGEVLQKVHEENKALTFMPSHLRQMIQTFGVAYHHSGLAPTTRIAVEQLIKDGLLRFCSATMGLSIGINFAVRAAMIGDDVRPGEDGPTEYSQSEVLQMLGRAGRRGQDPVGYSLWPDLATYFKMGRAQREGCNSNLRNDPTTFLGLIGRGYDLEKVETFYSKSFKRYQDKEIDLSLIQKNQLMKVLEAPDLPCTSPVHAVAQYSGANANSPCFTCPYRRKCHPYLENRIQGDLSALHLHLHALKALDQEEKLTHYGNIARYFPQNGGLLLSHYLDTKKISEENMLKGVELMGALSVASFKTIEAPASYRFPFDDQQVLKELEEFYPYDLFPEVYDPPRGRRRYRVIREFNPGAGYIIRQWLSGVSWPDLISEFAGPRYGTGDIMALMYRTSTYLQSLMQSPVENLREPARELRSMVLRDPVQTTLS